MRDLSKIPEIFVIEGRESTLKSHLLTFTHSQWHVHTHTQGEREREASEEAEEALGPLEFLA